jgi:hypothetical protein
LDQKIVDERSIKEVAKDLKLGKKSRRILIPLLSGIAIAVGILFLIHLQKGGYLSPAYDGVLRAFQYLRGIVIDEFHYLFNWVK